MHNCVDGLRQPLRRLLPTNFQADRDEARDALARSLVAGRISDIDTEASETDLTKWTLEQATQTTPADLRGSLYNFLTVSIYLFFSSITADGALLPLIFLFTDYRSIFNALIGISQSISALRCLSKAMFVNYLENSD